MVSQSATSAFVSVRGLDWSGVHWSDRGDSFLYSVLSKQKMYHARAPVFLVAVISVLEIAPFSLPEVLAETTASSFFV